MIKYSSVGILIRDLKHGLKKLPVTNGNLSHLHMVVLGLLGVGIGATGILLRLKNTKAGNLLLPGTSERKHALKSSCHVAGLWNLGNNCFFNVILQALASCGCFFPYLEDMLNTIDLKSKEAIEEMPLTDALASLLSDLGSVHKEAVVLNPRKVMVAMGLYLTSFSLTRQQDAAEAFLHLMSSLEEEFLKCYTPYHGSLVDITASDNVVSFLPGNSNDLQQWEKLRFGPFDGIIGSILVCNNCSSQLSIDFENFRCLPLSPIHEDYSSIMDGCTVNNCLRKLTTVERLESNHCGRCWHKMALKNLCSKLEENADKIKIVGSCFKQDSCECANLLHHEVAWSSSSHTLKQLWIAQCPKVLCLHLLRVSINHHGEVIKLKDHVSFPLVLDLSPFTTAVENWTPGDPECCHDSVSFMQHVSGCHVHNSAMLSTMSRLKNSNRNVKQQCQSTNFSRENLDLQVHKLLDGVSFRTIKDDTKNDQNAFTTTNKEFSTSSAFSSSGILLQDGKACKTLCSLNSKSYKYSLFSVVEHYGRPGTGHYAIYKKLSHPKIEDPAHKFDNLDQSWFYISDSNVSSVTIEAVLSAEASLLFYERIE